MTTERAKKHYGLDTAADEKAMIKEATDRVAKKWRGHKFQPGEVVNVDLEIDADEDLKEEDKVPSAVFVPGHFTSTGAPLFLNLAIDGKVKLGDSKMCLGSDRAFARVLQAQLGYPFAITGMTVRSTVEQRGCTLCAKPIVGTLVVCGVCGHAMYCSDEHLLQDRDRHKGACR